MSGTKGVRHQRWLLAGILLLAFALRLCRLGAGSLWYDETVSVHLAAKSLPALVDHTAGDIHPPGYYVLLHLWTGLAGSGGAAARDFLVAFASLWFGVLLVALAHRLARLVFGPRTALVAAFLVTLSPYNLWYSQEVRMYTLGAALALGVVLAVLPLLGMDTANPPAPDHHRLPSRRRLAVYVLCAAAGLWALYYFAFLLVAVNLLAGLWWLVSWLRSRSRAETQPPESNSPRDPRRFHLTWAGRWLLAQAAVLLLYLPWLPIAWRQATSPPVPPWRGLTGLGRVSVEVWSALSLGQSAEPAQVWPFLLLAAILFGLGLFAPRHRAGPVAAGDPGETPGALRPSAQNRRAPRCVAMPCLLAACTFLPIALIFQASYVTPLYHVRYAFTYSTPFYVVLAAGLTAVARRSRPAFWLLLALVLAFSGLSIYDYHTDTRYASDGHRQAVSFLAERWRPGDAILVNAGYVYTALESYWDGDPISWRGRLVGEAPPTAASSPTLYQAGSVDGEPGLGWGDPDSDFYAMSREETEQALAQLFANHDRVWLYRCYDTVTDPDGAIRSWFDAHGTPFEDQVFTGEAQLRVQGFLTGRQSPLAPEQPPDWLFPGSWLALEASRLPSDRVAVGGTLDLELLWRVQNPPPAGDPILFAGIYPEAGVPWGRVDERPLGSLFRPADWPLGASISTPLRIPVPAGTPPGKAFVKVGWYELVDGQVQWLPLCPCYLMTLVTVDVVAPEDWGALPLPDIDYPLGVTVGDGVRLLGMNAPTQEAVAGGALGLTLFWRAEIDNPDPGPAILQLAAADGAIVAEAERIPAGGLAPFAGLAAGQTVRDALTLLLPGDVAPGVYQLSLGRVAPDGTWLPIRRGPFRLGSELPLATIHVRGRQVSETPPAVQFPSGARFGDSIRLVGFDAWPSPEDWVAGEDRTHTVLVALHWQVLAGMDTRYKIFLHLTGEGGPADIRAQADDFPALPTTAWIAGEYLEDVLALELPARLSPGPYTLLLGLYDEASALRLPALGPDGQPLGDSLTLVELDFQQP